MTQWLQLTWTLPPAASPFGDTTGTNCMVAQRGPVWFLGSNSVIGGTQQKCTIPEDRAVAVGFVQININVYPHCGQTVPLPGWVLRSQLAQNFDSATNVSITVDGVPIPDVASQFRIKAKLFSIGFPQDNLLNQFCAPEGLPAGVYSPVAGEGIFVILKPLSVGKHSIRVYMEIKRFGWIIDDNFDIDVAAVTR